MTVLGAQASLVLRVLLGRLAVVLHGVSAGCWRSSGGSSAVGAAVDLCLDVGTVSMEEAVSGGQGVA